MNWNSLGGRLLSIAFALACSLTAGACSSVRHFEWTEDVQFSDQRMIVVQRSEESRRNVDPGAGFRTGWLFQKATISAELPTPASRKVGWEGDLSPLVLDIQPDSATYLVCLVATGSGQIQWHLPDHELYVVFRLTPSDQAA
jgi:hypothetical protein